jgi:cytoskeletal protein RodZ
MEHFFESLKQAREAKQLSLADISNATQISERFLNAIERGDVSILPQTYIRAFLREYAVTVGLDPAEVLRGYEETPAGRPAVQPSPPPLPQPAQPAATWKRQAILLGLVAVVSTLILLNTVFKKEAPPTQETPFQRVVTESEQRIAPPAPAAAAVPSAAAPADSLTLKGATIDSVWVRLVADEQPPREFLFGPDARFSWRARDRFVLTLGNAGGIEFTLNTKPLGAFGRRGSVIRDTVISRRLLGSP